MAYVRIHNGALTHPKIVGLPDKAFRLWVWGLSYCQMHLTDGLIPSVALERGVGSQAGVLITANLWEMDQAGWRVHDYLDWNDARSLVNKRRTEAKERMTNNRQSRSLNVLERTNRNVPFNSLSSSGSSSEGVQGKPQPFVVDGTPRDDIAERAGRFCERYAVLYQQFRRGARYLPRPALDFTKACDLCAIWPDDRLDKLATVFLKTDHDFAASGSRTIGQFAALASWCDDRLREVEAGGQ